MEPSEKRQRTTYYEEAQPSRCRGYEEARRAYRYEERSPPQRNDDEDGHYVFEPGENFTPRYKIVSKLGEGTFGQVLECWDRKYREYVAIKVVRNIPKYREAALLEVRILELIAVNDKKGSRGCLRLLDSFDYRGHICIVAERLGPSLYDFLKANHYRPFKLEHVREIARQLLSSVEFLHSKLSLIHTDLKPENVLLASDDYIKVPDEASANPQRHLLRFPKTCDVRLIDFGSATLEHQHHSSIVCTRQYRAPEIILGMGWSYPCDIWSIGCIIVELLSGDPLFQTHQNMEHLAMMERVLGPMPRRFISRVSKRAEKYFRQGRDLRWPEGAQSEESIQAVKRLPRLKELVEIHVLRSSRSLTDLLHGLLRYNPEERLTAREALQHRFFWDAP